MGRKRLLLLAPLAAWGITYVVLQLNKTGPGTMTSLFLHDQEPPLAFQMLNGVVCLSILILGVHSLAESRKIKRSKNKLFLAGQLNNLNNLIVSFITIFLILLIWYSIPSSLKTEPFNLFAGTIVLSIVSLFVFLFGFFSTRQDNIYKANKPVIPFSKPAMDLMQENKPYLDPSFSIAKLAVVLGEPPKKVSEAIKVTHPGTFLSFINQFRVNEAKEMIKDPSFRNYSLVAIGLESGFNSKATFNRVFKNETGMTPSDYRLRLIPGGEAHVGPKEVTTTGW